MYNKIDLIVPSIPADIDVLLSNLELFFKFLPIDSIIIIGPKCIEEKLPSNKRIKFINEIDLVDKGKVQKAILRRMGKESVWNDRSGWYTQQFLKMAYSNICGNEFYLLWDSDTVPMRKIDLFDKNGKPIFDVKTEYHKPYFDTISAIFPGQGKQIDNSFIAEHMLIKTKFMQSMIREIEDNNEIDGTDFIEKIINSISTDSILFSGFSEFETYGSYVQWKQQDSYSLREWKSLRFGGFFFPYDGLKKCDIAWVAKKYDAISFEKKHRLSFLANIVRTSYFQKVFKANVLEPLSLLLRIKSRISLYVVGKYPKRWGE